ncbi:MAG: type II toxin-antitoxin system RelE/ParE family toxin [Chloroflexi bacterium]|nr:type II toxin-antitoxin system RelE/ParE family toxin [Chloroflexota bacterium]
MLQWRSKEAASWWVANRPAAPNALEEELRRAFDLMSRQPQLGAPATNVSLSGIRRIQLSRVRYFLYYRVRSREIQILALWHTSRRGVPVL